MREEHDALGTILVPEGALWGATTQRSLENFAIGRDRYVWGRPVVEALGLVKAAVAEANGALGRLDEATTAALVDAATQVAAGDHDDAFPLVVWQTGSGTHTNMNANEVIATLAGRRLGRRVHPNDEVNLGQSSNDVFPTVLHLVVLLALRRRLQPALRSLAEAIEERATAFEGVVALGRTHLQDAVPLPLSSGVRAWATLVRQGAAAVEACEAELLELPIGTTAVGTGLHAHPDLPERACAELARRTGLDLRPAADPFALLSAHDAVARTSGALRTLALSLHKVANDVRFLASGPRAGLGELRIPANEPGSSIMPGKVNPSQAEALTMVAAHVLGNDATVAFAASQGAFQLNAYKPVLLDATLDSIELLADAATSFTERCIAGLELDEARIEHNVRGSLMLATALVPAIGHERAAAVAVRADREGTDLRTAGLAEGLDAALLDELLDPARMAWPHREQAPGS